MGRRMCATAAHLIDDVLPEVALRQWVLTFPFTWRRRLATDGALLSDLTRLFVETVHAFYARRDGNHGAKTGAVTVVQRTSSDLRLNPHLHVLFLDGAYHEAAGALVWTELPHLRTREVGEVLERALRRMDKHLRRRGLLDVATDDDASRDADPEDALAASAVSGQGRAGRERPEVRVCSWRGAAVPSPSWPVCSARRARVRGGRTGEWRSRCGNGRLGWCRCSSPSSAR